MPHPPHYMTIAEFAAYMSLSPRTIYRLIASGMPAIRVGRRQRIDCENAIVWVQLNAPLRRSR